MAHGEDQTESHFVILHIFENHITFYNCSEMTEADYKLFAAKLIDPLEEALGGNIEVKYTINPDCIQMSDGLDSEGNIDNAHCGANAVMNILYVLRKMDFGITEGHKKPVDNLLNVYEKSTGADRRVLYSYFAWHCVSSCFEDPAQVQNAKKLKQQFDPKIKELLGEDMFENDEEEKAPSVKAACEEENQNIDQTLEDQEMVFRVYNQLHQTNLLLYMFLLQKQ